MANALNIFSFPLHGQRLIEASAGTGKTFTIAGLYLRLLLGHGSDETAHQTALSVENILVVTFTEAATQELRDRIRRRIHQARRAFERGESDDEMLVTLLKSSKDHQADAKTLLNAERQMDEAAIYTIHSFCQRMLKQNAFESGSLFVQEVITDKNELELQATADFWRREFYAMDKSLSSIILSYWACPKALLKKIEKYLTGPLPEIVANDMPQNLSECHQKNIAVIDEFKRLWLENLSDIEQLMLNGDLKANSYKPESVLDWLRAISEWASQPTVNYHFPKMLEKFSAGVLADKVKKGKVAPSHRVFDAVEALLEQEFDFEDKLTKYAINEVRAILAKEKQRNAWLSFDDLLANLATALSQDQNNSLALRIRSLYPVAMIDEFQDTDPLQYSIFSTIYKNEPSTGLFMIGDPKQAIYAFRGADIFTYISARQAVSEHYNLDTNWRSSAEMVAAANHLFTQGKSPFIYDEYIPFIPVQHSPDATQHYWQYNDEKQAALTLWFDEKENQLLSKTEYETKMAALTAEHICELLNAATKGKASFVNKGKEQAIKPRDIAILVRTSTEAALVKKELAKRQITSVYLSDRNSVFSSLIAKDLERILNAVLTPENERNLRSALACSLFALSAEQIDKLNHDELEWELAASEFAEYQTIWFKKGVLPMLRQLIHQRQIAQRLLSMDNGDRQLTDLMHLGELLQKESGELDSHYALIRWLSDNIATPNGNSSAQQVRLESERDLVQIVTIHKSKGLEYKLVYLPFICSFRETKIPFYHDDEHQAILHLVSSNEAIEKAEKERLAEDLRLLYVAITRAIYGCILGIAPIRVGRSKSAVQHKSAIGYLLQQGEQANEAQLAQALKALVNEQDTMLLCQPPHIIENIYSPLIENAEALLAREFTGKIEQNWRISSYSGLVKQGHKLELDIAAFDIDAANEEHEEINDEPLEELKPFSSIFQFPKGARPGTFIHTLFENVDFTADILSQEVSQGIQHQLIRENYPEDWLPVLQNMLSTVLKTKLTPEGLSLARLNKDNRLNELEFMMSAQSLSAYSLNQLLQQHDPISAKAGKLDFKTVSGMLKGFIDLVFCWQGKYYLLDWKSNHLGDKKSSYNQNALVKVMQEHRYDFQYQIYTLALHRFLRSRIADYNYETHFGGVFYLFVRGLEEGSDNGIFHTKPDKSFIEQLDALFAKGASYAG